MGGVMIELIVGGFGVGGIIGMVCLVLYLWGK
ncbi:hypothetical protein [Paenibacillus xylanexedens]